LIEVRAELDSNSSDPTVLTSSWDDTAVTVEARTPRSELKTLQVAKSTTLLQVALTSMQPEQTTKVAHMRSEVAVGKVLAYC
jgi:hypothetical protein